MLPASGNLRRRSYQTSCSFPVQSPHKVALSQNWRSSCFTDHCFISSGFGKPKPSCPDAPLLFSISSFHLTLLQYFPGPLHFRGALPCPRQWMRYSSMHDNVSPPKLNVGGHFLECAWLIFRKMGCPIREWSETQRDELRPDEKFKRLSLHWLCCL